ncbi:hypothetical protein ACLIIZ_20630, partial [Azonexus caeni]|uniref:hypothetical protein n=1 Tax=Azonexus caeni TaxID=266126 RepID=UPI003A83BEF0
GRIASAVAKTRENRALPDKNHQISAIQAQFQQPGRLKSDRLLGERCLSPPIQHADIACSDEMGKRAHLSRDSADFTAYR